MGGPYHDRAPQAESIGKKRTKNTASCPCDLNLNIVTLLVYTSTCCFKKHNFNTLSQNMVHEQTHKSQHNLQVSQAGKAFLFALFLSITPVWCSTSPSKQTTGGRSKSRKKQRGHKRCLNVSDKCFVWCSFLSCWATGRVLFGEK